MKPPSSSFSLRPRPLSQHALLLLLTTIAIVALTLLPFAHGSNSTTTTTSVSYAVHSSAAAAAIPTRYFTQDSVNALHKQLQQKNTQMVVMSIVKNKSVLPIDHVYLIMYDTLLFLKPYAALYSFSTITERFEFVTMELRENVVLPKKKSKKVQELSVFGEAILNETSIAQFKPNAKYDQLKLCTPVLENSAIVRVDASAYQTFNCLDMYTNQTLTTTANKPQLLLDNLLSVLHVVVVVAFTYYVNLKLYHIRRVGKHRYVSDALSNPPYWQSIIPGISRKWKTNFRFWDSLWLMLVFALVYSLSIISTFVPTHWPLNNEESHFANLFFGFNAKELSMMIATFALIGVNILLTVYKIYRNATREKHLKLKPAFPLYAQLIMYLVAFMLSLFAVAVIVVMTIFVYPETLGPFKLTLFIILWLSFGVIMLWYLLKKPVSVSFWLYSRLISYTDVKATQVNVQSDDDYQLLNQDCKKPKLRKTLAFALIVRSWLLAVVWNATLILISLRAGRVATRFLSTTLVNILLNTEYLSTYTYAASIIGVFYKFTIDVEKPYITLKNRIVTQRGSLNMPRILATNKYLRKCDENQMKSDLLLLRERKYVMPLKWTTFAKVAEMTKLPDITRRILIQVMITLFALGIFYVAAASHDTKIFQKITDSNNLMAIITGTLMPLIPTFVSYFTSSEDGMDSEIFKERVVNSLKVLERRAENTTKEQFAWALPSTMVPFKFVLVSIVKEPKPQLDDDDDDAALLTPPSDFIQLKTISENGKDKDEKDVDSERVDSYIPPNLMKSRAFSKIFHSMGANDVESEDD